MWLIDNITVVTNSDNIHVQWRVISTADHNTLLVFTLYYQSLFHKAIGYKILKQVHVIVYVCMWNAFTGSFRCFCVQTHSVHLESNKVGFQLLLRSRKEK